MQSTNKPLPYLVPFAQNDGARTEVPATTPDATRFSQSLGSPPLTGMPPEAGGVPPQLSDFNGAMNQLARVPWWTLLGGRFAYDFDWATNALIGGYPRGAVLPAALGAGSVGLGEWYNTTENNVANPDIAGTGWVPGYQYGATVLTAQTGGTVVLTPAQAAKTTIRVSGALTSNLILVVPDWVYAWSVYNTTTGAFSVSIKNAATAAVVIPQDGTLTDIRGDGTSVSRNVQSIPAASQIAAGIQRNATGAEVTAAASSTLTVTPATLAVVTDLLAPKAAPSFNGNVTTNSDFIGGSALNLAAAGTGGTVTLRPNGVGSSVGQARVVGNGDFYAEGTFYSAVGQFTSSSLAARLSAAGGGGTIQFRPNGPAASVGEAYINTGGDLYVSGQVVPSGGFQNGSSRTVKNHVEDLDVKECLRSVLYLQPVAYTYHGRDAEREGYYAEQAVEAGFDRAVTNDYSPNAFSPLLVEDTQLLPRHTGAIHALYAMVLELQDKVRELEGR